MEANRKQINKEDLMGLPPSHETKSEEGQREFREWKQEEKWLMQESHK